MVGYKNAESKIFINFHKSLSGNKNSYLSGGFMAGFVTRQFDGKNLTFDNQYTCGAFNPSNPTGESFTGLTRNFFDVALGISYNSDFGENGSYYIGSSHWHFNKPSYSFLSDKVSINLICNAESVFLPNTFTPNGDGMNDTWYPRGGGIRQVKYLKVFNRWGQAIFERSNFNTEDRSAGWDGSYKGQPLPGDVFVFTMAVTCDNGQVIESKGNVMIVR